MERVEIGPGIHAVLQEGSRLGESNTGFIARGGGLVVDTMYDLPRTRSMLELFAEAAPSAGAPRRLVNTHHNGDHCWGNQVLADLGTEIIGHRLCAHYFHEEATPELFEMLKALDDPPPAMAAFVDALQAFDFTGITLTPPTTLLDDDGAVLDLDGTSAELRYLGPAHTAGDVVVWLPDEGVVFTGDLLFNQCTPIGWEGTFGGWIAALDAMISWAPAVVVPGHGPLGDVAALQGMRDYLAYVYDEAKVHFDAGRTTTEAARLIELGPYASWAEPERLAFQLDRAWRELSGLPWDTKVDATKIFAETTALRAHLDAS